MSSIPPAADTADAATPPRSRGWSEWSAADFAALDRARAIAVLPLAATEQHGPHLPLSVDSAHD